MQAARLALMAKTQPETEVSNRLRGWLEDHGWRVFRHNQIRVAGKASGGRVRVVKSDEKDKGLGDMLAFRWPHMVVIESKRPANKARGQTAGKLSDVQEKVFADPRVAPFCIKADCLEELRAGLEAMGIPFRA